MYVPIIALLFPQVSGEQCFFKNRNLIYLNFLSTTVNVSNDVGILKVTDEIVNRTAEILRMEGEIASASAPMRNETSAEFTSNPHDTTDEQVVE